MGVFFLLRILPLLWEKGESVISGVNTARHFVILQGGAAWKIRGKILNAICGGDLSVLLAPKILTFCMFISIFMFNLIIL